MLIAAISIGDQAIQLHATRSLSKDDEQKEWYILSFQDLPTGKRADLSYISENEAVLAFAAWIVADEPHLGALEPHLRALRTRLEVLGVAKYFMP